MIPMNDIKACFFDLDGTLIDSETIWMNAQCGYLRENYGADITGEEWLRIYWGHSWQDIFSDYDRRWIHGRVTKDEMSRATMKSYYEYSQTHDIIIHGSMDLLKKLKRLGYQVGIASGAHKERAVEFVRTSGLEGILDCLIASGDYVAGKPAPDCYLAAARRLNLEPFQCLAFEDSPSGVHSAKAAGLWCVGLERPGWAALPEADWVLDDLSKFEVK